MSKKNRPTTTFKERPVDERSNEDLHDAILAADPSDDVREMLARFREIVIQVSKLPPPKEPTMRVWLKGDPYDVTADQFARIHAQPEHGKKKLTEDEALEIVNE